MFTGYHAYLVMRQRLSYFHSVRYLLLISYVLFGAIVASEMFPQTSDVNLASFLLKASISAGIVAAILLGVATNVLTLQAKGNKSPYRELIRRRPTSLLITSTINTAVFILLWTTFNFQFNLGEKLLFGTHTLIPHTDILQLPVLSLVLVGFIWNQRELFSKDNIASQPESLSRVIRTTALLWMAMATILFTANVGLRTFGIDLVMFGNLIESLILGYLAYIYVKPTALIEFFASGSHLSVELKRKQLSRVFDFNPNFGNKILLEVDSVSDYREIVYYFLGSGWKPGVCVTYSGSPLLLAGSRNKGFKTIELSMNAEHVSLSKDEKIEVPLFKKNTYDLLKWSIESNSEGRLVLDGLTHLIQLLGVDEVYPIVSYLSELCTRNRVKLLLIINHQVHKLEVLSSFEAAVDCVIQLEKNRTKQIKPITYITSKIPTSYQARQE